MGTERIGLTTPSSPLLRRSSSSTGPAASPQQFSPSLPTSPPAVKRTISYPPLSLPAASRGDTSSIENFLKRNAAAVGKKLAGAAAGRSDAAK